MEILNGVGITDPASCGFTIEVSGVAVDQPNNIILTSSTTSACENESITHTAETNDCDDNTLLLVPRWTTCEYWTR